jgi:predicted nucleotidyltransferase component of viral defense system
MDIMENIDKIKRKTIIAMVSNDYLMERLVLKGGNAIDIVYQLSGRASIDLDYSIPNDFKSDESLDILETINTLLSTTFAEDGLSVFDLKFEEKTTGIGQIDEMEFWGGYSIEFKLIPSDYFSKHSDNLNLLQKNASIVGPNNRKTFKIDIGKFEYCLGKVAKELDGYTLFVYSTEMLVLEKLRAICQQMPEYREMVKSHPPAARARDFFDIYIITQQFPIDMNNPRIKELLTAIFAAKRVPLDYLNRILNYRDFHRRDFVSLKDTVKSGVELKDFDFYFDYVINMINTIKF